MGQSYRRNCYSNYRLPIFLYKRKNQRYIIKQKRGKSKRAKQTRRRAISIANTLTALAADANGDTNANDTITTGMQYNVAGGNANFNSASTEIAITSITSTAADTAMDIAGAGGVKVTGNLTKTF